MVKSDATISDGYCAEWPRIRFSLLITVLNHGTKNKMVEEEGKKKSSYLVLVQS